MKHVAIVLFGLTLLGFGASCAKKDEVVSIADSDPEMIAAIARARGTLPQFWQTFAQPSRGEKGFALKVRITDNNGNEHFWLTGIERRDGKIFGSVDNDPNIVKSVKLGKRLVIQEADISDWLYMRDGKMVGNFTLPPLFKKMPAEEVQHLKSIMESP